MKRPSVERLLQEPTPFRVFSSRYRRKLFKEGGGRAIVGKQRGIESGIFPLNSLRSEFLLQEIEEPVGRSAFDSRQ